MKRKLNLLPLILVAFLFFLMNSYLLSGLHSFSQQTFITPVFWLIVSAIIFSLVYAILRMQSKGMDLFFKIATHAFLILVVAELIFALVLLPNDLYRLTAGVPRNSYWLDIALFAFVLTIFIFIYGMVKGKYAYRVIRHQLYFEDLPENFDGFTITQISDVHAGSFNNPKAVQRGIDLIKKQQSDLFVFTGDLVNNLADEIKPWINAFKQIKAPFGQFSVLGNHDYGDYVKWESDAAKRANLERLKAYHKDLGYKLLLDEHVQINKDGQKIILAGVENWGIGFGERGDLKKALSGSDHDDFKVLLSHDPTHWAAEVLKFPSKVQLTLSGHTHGMQFGIEAFGIKWSPVKYRYAHWGGVTGDQGTYLNINRGFGFLGFSGRIGIWPEITVIELKRGSV